MRLSVNHFLPLAAAVLLPGCVSGGGGHRDELRSMPNNGPAADYPVVVGDPFTIGGVTYSPVDTLNYDAVGYASVSNAPGSGVSAAHKTLPLPSYVEVTDLDSGRTILVRLESRGPMVNVRLIELSPGAAEQLGIIAGSPTAVRVRRVNPPEAERALLRMGQQAPERMETPKPLLAVLKRKLAAQETLVASVQPAPMTTVDPDPYPAYPEPAPPPVVAAAPVVAAPAPQPVDAPVSEGNLIVQVAAFSTRERALRAAVELGGSVSKPGQYWYMRLGPYATPAQAATALEKARAAGYSDARIQRVE